MPITRWCTRHYIINLVLPVSALSAGDPVRVPALTPSPLRLPPSDQYAPDQIAHQSLTLVPWVACCCCSGSPHFSQGDHPMASRGITAFNFARFHLLGEVRVAWRSEELEHSSRLWHIYNNSRNWSKMHFDIEMFQTLGQQCVHTFIVISTCWLEMWPNEVGNCSVLLRRLWKWFPPLHRCHLRASHQPSK